MSRSFLDAIHFKNALNNHHSLYSRPLVHTDRVVVVVSWGLLNPWCTRCRASTFPRAGWLLDRHAALHTCGTRWRGICLLVGFGSTWIDKSAQQEKDLWELWPGLDCSMRISENGLKYSAKRGLFWGSEAPCSVLQWSFCQQFNYFIKVIYTVIKV